LTANIVLILSVAACLGKIEFPRLDRRHLAVVCVMMIAWALFIGLWAFDDFMYSSDEYAYLFQAMTFRAGRLWNQPPPLGNAQTTLYVWVVAGKWVAQYPPGWPLVLAAAGAVFPTYRMANALIVALTMLGVAELARRRAGDQAAWLAVLTFAFSAFALCNGAAYYSHPLAGALAVAAMLSSQSAAQRNSRWFSLLAGCAIGYLCITRSATAAVVGVLVFLEQVLRPRWFARLVLVAAGGAPFLAILLLYQYAVTGDALMPVYWLTGRRVDHLYFDLPSVILSLRNDVTALSDMSLYVSAGFDLLGAIAFALLAFRRKLAFADFVFPLGLLIFLFYPLPAGYRFGPRYQYDFWPTAVATIAVAVLCIGGRWNGLFRNVVIASAVQSAAIALLLPFEWHRVSVQSDEVYRLAAQMKLKNAIVCPRTSSSGEVKVDPRVFARNGITTDNPVLFIDCDQTNPAAIQKAYPNRTIWYFSKDPATKIPTLTRE
jgi:hypothetical protein